MRRNKTILLIVTLILTAAATAMRVWMLPIAAGDGMGLTRVNLPLIAVLLGATAVSLALGFVTKTKRIAPLADGTVAVSVAGVLFGALMLGTCAWEAWQWAANGIVPPPDSVSLSSRDDIALAVSMLCGVVGGVFLIARFIGRSPVGSPLSAAGTAVTGVFGVLAGVSVVVLAVKQYAPALSASGHASVGSSAKSRALWMLLMGVLIGVALIAAFIRWMLRGERRTGWVWLLPVLWMLARLWRYHTCYVTSADASPAAYEILTYGVSALFLLAAAQYFSGVMTPSRWLRGLCAATAVLTLAATVSRLILWGLGETLAVAYCPLPSVVDVGVGLFALTLVATLSVEEAPAEA